jgi:hypothetical protein
MLAPFFREQASPQTGRGALYCLVSSHDQHSYLGRQLGSLARHAGAGRETGPARQVAAHQDPGHASIRNGQRLHPSRLWRSDPWAMGAQGIGVRPR